MGGGQNEILIISIWAIFISQAHLSTRTCEQVSQVLTLTLVLRIKYIQSEPHRHKKRERNVAANEVQMPLVSVPVMESLKQKKVASRCLFNSESVTHENTI